MAHRKVKGLVRAHGPISRPKCIPKSKPKGTKALGLSFERKLKSVLPKTSLYNPWFNFTDSSGNGYCAPDWLIPTTYHVVIIESKLTRVYDARAQLLELYMPVVGMATGKTPIPVPLVKSLTRLPPNTKVVSKLGHAIDHFLSTGEMAVVHWIGVGDL